MKYCRY